MPSADRALPIVAVWLAVTAAGGVLTAGLLRDEAAPRVVVDLAAPTTPTTATSPATTAAMAVTTTTTASTSTTGARGAAAAAVDVAASVDIDFDAVELPPGVELLGPELAPFGIAIVRAVPEGEYCADAVAAVYGAGEYRGAPKPFLTSQTPGRPGHCNGVALELTLLVPARSVRISFWGADRPYALRAFDDTGAEVASAIRNAWPYDYASTYDVEVAVDAPVIRTVTFGDETALTMIHAIELR